jgi:hypothetical protein
MKKPTNQKEELNSLAKLIRRDMIEQQLLVQTTRGREQLIKRLESMHGFVDYYFYMRDCYPTPRLAYERLEQAYIALTSFRRYGTWGSFRGVLRNCLRIHW